ncbi:M3 family oligoendopeptidase [candidate division CSSED10-310 bacterium]|uniref:M3 family oligoendopeptidase n=1 Tax=candidate division CSSED10-310 bacterium TaxID=2855610 RepID=A0ABV6Z0A4_UNCC1
MSNNKQHPEDKLWRKRLFLPAEVDLTSWKSIEPFYKDLLQRPIGNSQELAHLIRDFDEMGRALIEKNVRLHIATTVDTSDQEAARKLQYFNEEILSKLNDYTTRIIARFMENPYRYQLDPDLYGHLEKLYQNELDLYVEENVPLFLKAQNLIQRHSAIIGGITVEHDDQSYNLAKMSVYLQDPDRSVREAAWRAMGEEKIKVSEEVDEVFDELIKLRDKQARNAGFENFRDYRHQVYNRFDYTPVDCTRFHKTVLKHGVPVLKKIQQNRMKQLGITDLRPWDHDVDPGNLAPLKPFRTVQELVNGAATLLDSIYPQLGNRLRELDGQGNLDLVTRPNKAMVGYNSVLEETGSSFIFMNSVGLHSDLKVLIHEVGHAIEKSACLDRPFSEYRHAPMEWCELASQSHELLALDHLDTIYPSEADRKRCIANAMEDLIEFFPRIAKIDAFQHWLYTHPNHSRQERRQTWLTLCQKYGGLADYSGLEQHLEISWQIIAHLFLVPFYYIEYGIAQLGALQIWRNVRENGNRAMKRFLGALELGFSKPLPDLYHQAGIRFEFYGPLFAELIKLVEDEYYKNSADD